jgi:hypothetical protein
MTKSDSFFLDICKCDTLIHTYVIFMYLQIHIIFKLMDCMVCGIHNWLHPNFLQIFWNLKILFFLFLKITMAPMYTNSTLQ